MSVEIAGLMTLKNDSWPGLGGDADIRPEPSVVIINAASNFWHHMCDCSTKQTELALEMLERARASGHLKTLWLAGDSAFRMSQTLREGLAEAGMQYVLDVRPDMTVWPLEPGWTNPPYQGVGRPRKPRLRREERQIMTPRSLALPVETLQEITVAAGSQGPRTYRFSDQRGPGDQ